MHPPLSAAGEAESPTKFSKRGGLTGLQSLEGGGGEKGVTLFGGFGTFTQKIN